jgi:carboxypeptidase C (cathepsin A)
MVLWATLATASALGWAAGDDADASDGKEDTPVPELLHFSSEHRARIGGETVEYTATAGTLALHDEDETLVAHFGYTAYLRSGEDPVERPVLFAYNGGPGSASMWLHMGILGPRRVEVTDLTFTTEGPFRSVENGYSILDVADLVMIDPVGTGFSRAVGEAKGEDFWGVDADVDSVSRFIVAWLNAHGRWASPKYLLGESYGGIRSGGVAYALLTKHNVALNGVILVSPFMDYVAGNAGFGNDLPYVNYLTTFAATAWYHEVVEDRPDDLRAFLAEAETFALNDYAPLLMKGERASAAERTAVLAGMERFTGIDAEYWDRANLRIDEGTFAKQLLRDRRQVVGRIDSRFVGDGIDHNDDRFAYDPFFPSVGPAFVAAFNHYYRETLGVKTTRPYVTSAGLYGK